MGARAGAAALEGGAPPGAVVGAAEPAGAAEGAVVPSVLALLGAGAAAGAGSGVELLHPLKIRVAERAKLAANARNFSRMVVSVESNLLA